MGDTGSIAGFIVFASHSFFKMDNIVFGVDHPSGMTSLVWFVAVKGGFHVAPDGHSSEWQPIFMSPCLLVYPERSTNDVSLQVYNMLGQNIMTLVNGRVEAGIHSYSFNGSNLASGIYIYRLKAGNKVITKQMVLMK